MNASNELVFEGFHLESRFGPLIHGSTRVKLRDKSLALLHYLASNPMKVVTKSELLEAVWKDTHVSATVVKVCVREIRKALAEHAPSVSYVETVGKRGYRFVTKVTSHPSASDESSDDAGGSAWMQAHLRILDQQGVSLVFLPGHLSAEDDKLLASLTRKPERAACIAHGFCVLQSSHGESYLPVLEALGRLCRLSENDDLRSALWQYAPTWLQHLPGLVTDTEFRRLRRRTRASSTERMLRELADALEVFTQTSPLVFLLEDLHWSDRATLDLLNYLVRRGKHLRLLLIGTYRAEGLADNNPHLYRLLHLPRWISESKARRIVVKTHGDGGPA